MQSNIRYISPARPEPGALRLHCNEGATPPLVDAELARRYPNLTELQQKIAGRVGRTADEVVVTAGADGAIDRVMRAFAGPGATVAVADPTFEMIPVYAAQSGAEVVRVPWVDEYPAASMVDANPDVLAIVTPDNPTGRTVSWSTVAEIAGALPNAVILLDLAYVEYADEDLTARAADVPNIVVTRTFSKAWGLAGLRVGYAIAAPELAGGLRAVGSPYPVSSSSAAQVDRCLGAAGYVDEHVARVQTERAALTDVLVELGASPTRSQANFVFARFGDADFVCDALRVCGIEVRRFRRAGLEDALRIGCPASAAGFQKLDKSLRTTLRPDALLFDMDGVLADVRRSYRAAIIDTCASWGVEVCGADIALEKTRPGSNDDFVVTRRMLNAHGVDAPLEIVTRRFQASYDAGLWAREELLVDPAFLERLAGRFQLAIVTGRPRPDAERFLQMAGIEGFFDAVVCREDAPMKPNPDPVQLALQKLGARTAWMFGDTADDIQSAAAAGALPLGVTAPGENSLETLADAGAVRVVSNVQEVERWLT